MLLGKISELRYVREKEEGASSFVDIGSLMTPVELLRRDIIPYYIKKVIRSIAALGIRNIATIGGNISNASPAVDILVPLYCLNATVELARSAGKRTLGIQDFLKGSGKIELRRDELLLSVSFENTDFTSAFYRKVGTRRDKC